MSNSDAHPRIRSRRKGVATEKMRKLAQDRKRCVVALETAVQALSELKSETQCDQVKILVANYEWAIEELQTTGDDSQVDPSQVISITRLLQRLT